MMPFKEEVYRITKNIIEINSKIEYIPTMKMNISMQTKIMSHFSQSLKDLQNSMILNP